MIYILKKPASGSATIASMTVNSFSAQKIQLNLSERQSTMSLTLDETAPVISVGNWLRDDTDPGKGIVWRVKSIDTDYSTNTRTVQCEHMIRILHDEVLFGEVTPAKITDKKTATKCTAKQAVQYILKSSADWTLGSFGFSKSAPYNFNGDDLLGAIEKVSGSLLDAWWNYDFSSYPFKLNIVKKDDTVAAEMRMSRNIRTLKKTIDMSRMYTRFYPIGKNNKKLSGKGYVQKNTSLYGIVSKVETDSELDTEEKLTDWANERLNLHAEPSITVTISGMELAATTGEPLDRLTLGRMCRVPLPEFSTTITERITKLSYSDKIADPENVSVTLANAQEDVASIINQLQKRSSAGGRASAKNAEEDHAWIEDTTDHVSLIAEAFGGKGPDGKPNWSRVSQWTVDGNGISGTVTKTVNDMVAAQSKLTQTETKIDATVSAIGQDGKVTAATIAVAINESTGKSEAKINADHIYIGNEKSTTVIKGKLNASDFTAEKIGAKLATLAEVNVKSLKSERGGISVYSVGTTSFYQGGVSCYVPSALTSLRIQQSGNTYTLQMQSFGDELKDRWRNVGSFSRATSLSGAWSSGTLTVTASPQNEKWIRSLSHQLVASTPAIKIREVTGSVYTDTGYSVNLGTYLEEKNITANGTYYPNTSGNKVGFSKVTVSVSSSGTSLGGSWSSGRLTVTASPQGTQWIRQLSHTLDVDTSSAAANTHVLRITSNTTSGTIVTEQTGYNVSLRNYLERKTITANGTYYPDKANTKIGLYEVVVDVPTSGTALEGTWNNGLLTVKADPQNVRWQRRLNHQLDLSGDTPYMKITAQTTDTTPVVVETGHQFSLNTYLESLTATSNNTYTPSSANNKIGFREVTVNVTPTTSYEWGTNGRLTVTVQPKSVKFIRNFTHQLVYTDDKPMMRIMAYPNGTPPQYEFTGHEFNMNTYLTTLECTGNGVYTPDPAGTKVGFRSVKVAVPYALNSFSTYAIAGDKYDNYTNNSSGYYIYGAGRNRTVAIVVRGSIMVDDKSLQGFSVLRSVPQAIFQKGWDEARRLETSIRITRGAYDPLNRTYSCTCTVPSEYATGSTFYLYART